MTLGEYRMIVEKNVDYDVCRSRPQSMVLRVSPKSFIGGPVVNPRSPAVCLL